MLNETMPFKYRVQHYWDTGYKSDFHASEVDLSAALDRELKYTVLANTRVLEKIEIERRETFN